MTNTTTKDDGTSDRLSAKSKVVAAIAGAALEPFVYFLVSPLFVMLVGTEPKNVAAKAMAVALLSFGAWLCLLVIIALRLKKRLPGLARYFIVGAFFAMAVMMVLPFLKLALGVNIVN
jgi:hypothetical protein